MSFIIKRNVLVRYKGGLFTGYHTKVTVPNSVTEIGGHAFSDGNGNSTTEVINLPMKLQKIQSLAFSNCYLLEKLTIPESVYEIGGWAFGGCKSLKTITIPKLVTKLGWRTFESCESLKEVILPNSITEIGRLSFRGCYSLENITIPGMVKILTEGLFADCRSLKTIIIPNSINEIEKGVFEDCNSLESITIPNTVNKFSFGVFNNCKNLKIITIPYIHASKLYQLVGDLVFVREIKHPKGCEALSTIFVTNFPEKNKDIKYIHSHKLVGVNADINRQVAIDALSIGEKLLLVPEPNNEYDSNAILVKDTKGNQIGYISREINVYVNMLMKLEEVEAKVFDKIGGGKLINGIKVSILPKSSSKKTYRDEMYYYNNPPNIDYDIF